MAPERNPGLAGTEPSSEEVRQRVNSLYDRAESATGTYNATRAMNAASRTRTRGGSDGGRRDADPVLDAIAQKWFDRARASLGPTVPAMLPADRKPQRAAATAPARPEKRPGIEPPAPAELPSARPVRELTAAAAAAPAEPAGGAALALPPASPSPGIPQIPQTPPTAAPAAPAAWQPSAPDGAPASPAVPDALATGSVPVPDPVPVPTPAPALQQEHPIWSAPVAPPPAPVPPAAPDLLAPAPIPAPRQEMPTTSWAVSAPTGPDALAPAPIPALRQESPAAAVWPAAPDALGSSAPLRTTAPEPLAATSGSWPAVTDPTVTGLSVPDQPVPDPFLTGPSTAQVSTGAPASPPLGSMRSAAGRRGPAPSRATREANRQKLMAAAELLAARRATTAPTAVPVPAPPPTAVPASAAVPAPAPVPGAAAWGGRAAQAVAFARAQVGKPCVQGATGPESYDRASLTQAAWRAAGVDLPRAARDQARAGMPVPLTELLPGDLVFLHGDADHVGLYTGDGLMVHAPAPGAVIREESLPQPAETAVREAVRPA
ncbi:C40 family peptidase [Streptomyces echinoruber]|uniref:C40 family peptidase n=1 Tax=Streptomyces echinoruber TaxID=68898 RepID=UPI003606C207